MKLFGGAKPDHPMADRKEARRLLDALPAQDLKAAEELAHWHESASTAQGLKPEERAQRIAMIDETGQQRLKKLERDYLTAARGARASRAQENLVWTRIHEYWRQAAQAYVRCIDAKSPPEVILGGLRALAEQLKWQQRRYGPIDPAVWGMMNRVYALAEARPIAEARPEFLKAAMFAASSPDSLLAHELELAERLIAALAPGFALAKAATPELPYWIDLAQAMAPARALRPPQAAPGLRCFGPGTAAAAVRGMIERIESGRGIASELKLGAGADAELVLGVLRHFALYWAAEPPGRKHARHSMKSSLTVTHGFDGVVQALGGAGESLDFGKGAGESWTVENVSAGGFGALVPQAKSDWLKVGALLAVQPDGGKNWLVGTVRRLSKLQNRETRVGVRTLSRAPTLSRFALRSTEAQGVLLPGQDAGEAAIALRAGIYAPGENLEASIGGKQHVYLPQGVAERGEDYEIVKFKEMVRES